MRDDGPPGQRAQVDEREDDDFTSAPLDAPRGLPPRMAALTSALALRGARRRALTLAATTLLVAVVIVGLLVHVASDPRGAVGALLHLPTPTPAATFVPGANLIYFSDGAPWGALTVDGKRLPQADLTGYITTVTRGAHQLIYQARYFPSVRCVFSAPQAPSDTCKLDTSADANQFLLSQAPLARVIDLGSTGATLRPDQRATLTQRANEQLRKQSPTATIAPGERYLDDSGQVVVASAPLSFHLSLALGDAAPPNGVAGCAQFCPVPLQDSLNGPSALAGGWMTQVYVTESWAILNASGRSLTSATYLVGERLPLATPAEVSIQLTSTGWKLNWVDALADNAIQNLAMTAASQAIDNAGKGSGGLSYSFTAAPNPLDGCVMDVQYGTSSATARVFWRFGVLLAVDTTARNILSALPVANAQEQAAVTSILTRPSAT
ncbi:MAG TPA: hypothetical protein VIG77_05075 [Ktedonobacterales bacterium]|jgi:hypothetical protein